MNAIDGVIAELASRTDRPQGYPFSRITVTSVCPEILPFLPHLNHIAASDLPQMRRLDFKKAGKAMGAEVKGAKERLARGDASGIPPEFIITAEQFDPVDEPTRKTTGCRKYLVEVECEDCPDRWEAICFRKAVKKYVTEELALNIVPPIFGDKYPEPNPPCVARVTCRIFDCKESLYQALEQWGTIEFADLPIRLSLPTRVELYRGLNRDGYAAHTVGGAVVGVRIG
jgi:hypothetical protein